MWKTLGHQNQKAFLENALKTKKYAHAYLFCGPSDVGKRTLALEFASKILGVSDADAKRANPDLIVLDQQSSSVGDMRTLMAGLSLRPYHYHYKVAVIDNFDSVNEEAANSLLKTLEEPNPTTIIILIAANRKAVLPTVVSRVQVLHFNRLGDDELAGLVSDARFLPMFDGKAGMAVRFQQDADFAAGLQATQREFETMRSASQSGRLLAVKKYAELETAELSALLGSWLDSEHRAMRAQPQRYKNLALLVEAAVGLRRNFNKKLILEKLFLHLT